eukprot:SAG25_NODE_173_length_12920_cov_18.688168_5_plen_242_part_00
MVLIILMVTCHIGTSAAFYSDDALRCDKGHGWFWHCSHILWHDCRCVLTAFGSQLRRSLRRCHAWFYRVPLLCAFASFPSLPRMAVTFGCFHLEFVRDLSDDQEVQTQGRNGIGGDSCAPSASTGTLGQRWQGAASLTWWCPVCGAAGHNSNFQFVFSAVTRQLRRTSISHSRAHQVLSQMVDVGVHSKHADQSSHGSLEDVGRGSARVVDDDGDEGVTHSSAREERPRLPTRPHSSPENP